MIALKKNLWLAIGFAMSASLLVGAGCKGDDETEETTAGDGDGDGDSAVDLSDCEGICAAVAATEACEDKTESACLEECAFVEATCPSEAADYLECSAEETEVACIPMTNLGIVGACQDEALAIQVCIGMAGDGDMGGGGGGS